MDKKSWTLGACAAAASIAALCWSAAHHQLLLYGDAVAHLHIARRMIDTQNPTVANLGSVWLPLPHLLLAPFVARLSWWQSGIPGAIPAMVSYVAAVVAVYRLARYWMPPAYSGLAAFFFAANPGLLYLQTTAMTEPLFLALFLWALIFTVECARGLAENRDARAARALLGAGCMLAAAVLTRYDGWVLCAFIGCYLLFAHGRRILLVGSPALRVAAALFCVLVLAAPLFWLWFNAHYFHDPLDFARGPYSAQAIEARTSLPGHAPHPGYHRPWIALRYYLRVATLGAGQGAVGNFVLLALALPGMWVVWRAAAGLRFVALTLWFPLAFYTYAVSYGAVPIFMPIWPPFSFYNTRYGLELLPAFALCSAAALWWWARRSRRPHLWLGIGIALVVLNAATLAAHTPLILREARANSATRVPFEHALAAEIARVPADARLLMYASSYAGALQAAARPLRSVTSESDYYAWRDALEAPAAHAEFVLAMDGDPVAQAVAAHPEGLQIISVVNFPGQPRAVFYRSLQNAPAAVLNSAS